MTKKLKDVRTALKVDLIDLLTKVRRLVRLKTGIALSYDSALRVFMYYLSPEGANHPAIKKLFQAKPDLIDLVEKLNEQGGISANGQ